MLLKSGAHPEIRRRHYDPVSIRPVVLAGLLALLLSASTVNAQSTCRDLSEAARKQILAYVNQRHGFPSTMRLELEDDGAVQGCYRKVEVRSGTQGLPFQQTLLVSPDQRFVTPQLFDLSKTDKEEKDEAALEVHRQLRKDDGVPTFGHASPGADIVLFSDFQCSYCQQAAILIREIADSDKGAGVRVQFRHHPLKNHPWARHAAEAAACLNSQSASAFWSFHDYLFSQQAVITADNLGDRISSFLRQHKREIDEIRYLSCLASAYPAEVLLRDENLASGLEISGTPTLFVNGSRQEGLGDPDRFRLMIEDLASKKQSLEFSR